PNMGSQFGDLHVANRGISGDTTRGMLIRLEEDVLALRPRGVVMLMGTNDLEEGASPKTIANNIGRILDQLIKSDRDLRIVLCNVFPSSATKKRPATQIQDINGRLQKLVSTRTSVTLVDTWTLFANEKGDAKPSEFPDLLHPNADGYSKWAMAIRPVFATLQWTETTPDEFQPETGFEVLFNGKDLTGWQFTKSTDAQRKSSARMANRKQGAIAWPIFEKDQLFDGETITPDGRYAAIHGRLVVTTPEEGRRIQQLWTQASFADDFTLKMDFRATPNADSGVFIRGRQLQCRDYELAGPYDSLTRYRPGDWNELVIEVRGNSAHCTCNGEILEQAFRVPESGPIGLEGDRGQIEYRRIRLRRD
ncbi:MAG: GDSL-type esterase/lipase family protein, partial [Planctomycetota bacterium]